MRDLRLLLGLILIIIVPFNGHHNVPSQDSIVEVNNDQILLEEIISKYWELREEIRREGKVWEFKDQIIEGVSIDSAVELAKKVTDDKEIFAKPYLFDLSKEFKDERFSQLKDKWEIYIQGLSRKRHPVQIAVIGNQVSGWFFKKDSFAQALWYIKSTYAFIDRAQPSEDDAVDLNSLQYREMKLYEKLGYYELAKNVALKRIQRSDRVLHWDLTDLGKFYSELCQYDSASYYLIQALKMQPESHRSNIHQTLADVYLKQAINLDLAKAYLDSAYIYRWSLDSGDTLYSIASLAEYFLIREYYPSAESMLSRLQRSLKDSILISKADESDVSKLWFRYHGMKYRLSQINGEERESRLYSLLQDSVFNVINQRSQADRLYLDKQIELNEVAEQGLKQAGMLQVSRKTIIGLLLLLVIVIMVTYYFIRNSKRLRYLSDYNDLLLREQNHRVKNNLQMVASLLSLQAGKTKDESSREALRQSQGRIQAIALLNRSLYDQKEIGDVDLKGYVQELVEEVINSITDSAVEYQLDIDDIQLDLEKTTSLGLIINELIVNSVKHGKRSELLFNLRIKKSTNQFLLEYSDNGEEFDLNEYENSKSFGKKLIQLQTQQLKGRSKVESKDGFSFILYFP